MFNFNSKPLGGRYDLIPEDDYEVFVESAEERPTNSGRLQLSVKLRIRDDVPQKYQNRLLFLNVFKKKTPNELDMQVEGYNYSHLYHLLDVSGLLTRDMQFESMSDICRALVGCELRVTVRHETYKGALQVKIDPENGVQPSRVTYGAPPDVETSAMINSSVTDFDDGDVPF